MTKTKKTTTQTDDTQKAVADLREEIVMLTMQKHKAQLKNTTSLRTKKDELARLLTSQTMKALASNSDKKEEVK